MVAEIDYTSPWIWGIPQISGNGAIKKEKKTSQFEIKFKNTSTYGKKKVRWLHKMCMKIEVLAPKM